MNANLTSSTVSDNSSVSNMDVLLQREFQNLEGLDDSLRDLYQALGKHLIVSGVDAQ